MSYAEELEENMIIYTEDTAIDKVKYNNFNLRVNKIIPEGNGKAAYCLVTLFNLLKKGSPFTYCIFSIKAPPFPKTKFIFS